MARNHKSQKGKKIRAKTTLPPVKESKQNVNKSQRSVSISPSVQHKTHRKRISVKKDFPEKSVQSSRNDPSPHSTELIDRFSKLNITDKKGLNNIRQPNRNYSTEGKSKKSGTRSLANSAKFSNLQDVARLITSGRAKNIIVMAGAGISTGSGIPDFRTPGTGLYDNLQQYRIPSPTAIFDLDYFHYDPKPFFALAKELYPTGKYQPCLPHYFVRLLHEKGLLLRMYTQNIDGLERIAGLPPEKLVEAHGTFSTASCTRCGKKCNGEEIKRKVLNGMIPRCQSTELCWGIVKPDIVFFGEDLPRRFYYYLKDFPSCDLLIIMGTSLEVEPFAGLTSSVRSSTPRLLLNRELVGPFASRSLKRNYDVAVTEDLSDSIKRFVQLTGWKDDLKQITDSVTFAEEEVVEDKDAKSDTTSTDSGLSSPTTESSNDSRVKKPTPLLPPDNNIKRYFHTLRTTPLPKTGYKNTDAKDHVERDTSYYDFIRVKKEVTPNVSENNLIKNIRRTVMNGNRNRNSEITIQYAETVKKKKSKAKVTSFGTGGTNYFLKKSAHKRESSSSSDSSNESQSESSGQESSYTSV